MRAYSLQPSPEALYSIAFSDDFDLEQKGAPNSLNYTYLGFLKAAFQKNMFLISHIRDSFKSLSDLNRAKFILILAVLGEKEMDASALSEPERRYQGQIRAFKLPDPYGDWDPFLGAAQIDMLWGEFFANGTYKPIRRILNILSHAQEAAFADGLSEKSRSWNSTALGRSGTATFRRSLMKCSARCSNT